MSEAFFERWFPGEWNVDAGFLNAIASVLPEKGKVLDLGCGQHTFLSQFRTLEREVWGVDFQEHPQQANREFFRLLGPGGAIPFADGTFDVLTACMVLEHVEKPEALVAEVNRVLKSGGHFVGITISSIHYIAVLRRLFSLLPHSFNQWLVHKIYGREECDTFPAFYRMNTPERLARQFGRQGFKRAALHRFANAGYFAFSPTLHKLAIMTDSLLEKIHPGLGRIYFVDVLQKAQSQVTSVLEKRAA